MLMQHTRFAVLISLSIVFVMLPGCGKTDPCTRTMTANQVTSTFKIVKGIKDGSVPKGTAVELWVKYDHRAFNLGYFDLAVPEGESMGWRSPKIQVDFNSGETAKLKTVRFGCPCRIAATVDDYSSGLSAVFLSKGTVLDWPGDAGSEGTMGGTGGNR